MDQQPERPHYERRPDLTPEEIAARAAAIRDGWSEEMELRRRITPPAEQTADQMTDRPSVRPVEE
ncbi:MAG: hypothetical protein ACC645_23310 [Pirellulales bacterium]